MITLLAFCMLILGLGPLLLYVIGWTKDPLHPLIIIGVASYFVSADALLKAPDPAVQVLGPETFIRYLLVSIISLVGFYLGWIVSKRRDRKKFTDIHVTRLPRRGGMAAIALFCSLIGVAAFVITYHQYTITGYVRDLSMLWITAAILVVQVLADKEGSGFRGIALCVLAIAVIPPATLFWTYGQRGDTVRLALICSMFYLIRETRPRKTPFIIAACAIALTLATLTQTRAIVNEDPTENRFTALVKVIPHYFSEKSERYDNSQEFMFGAALDEATAESGRYNGGRAWTLRLITRFTPKEFFADKWSWFGTSMASQFALVRERFGMIVPDGSAISGFSEGFYEIGWFCPLVWFILGFAHQKLWYRTLHSARRHYAGYLTAFNIAMLYAILQDIYTAEMNMLYVLIPLYFSYRLTSAPVQAETPQLQAEPHQGIPDAGSMSLA